MVGDSEHKPLAGEALAGETLARSGFTPIFFESGPSIEPGGESGIASVPPGPAAHTSGGKAAAGAQRPAQRQLARTARAEYGRALSRLAAGNHRAALEALMASEQRVVEAIDAEAVDLLSRTQSRILASLPDADWGCVLPVILLHLDLSRAYRLSGQRILAHHAIRMTIDLAEAYADKLATSEAGAEAAQALSSLAGHAQHGGVLSQAERLFTRALDLAGDDLPALLGLATIYEKRGLFSQAVPVLERLIAERPEHAEGTLRLALNRARTGEIEAAKTALRQLTTRRDSDWVTLLAHQELARQLIEEGQEPRAAGVLRRGLKRWPGHATLEVQLAWVLDTQGEPDASLELLENLGSLDPRPAGERSRYNRWPGELLAAGRRALAETARRRLPDLDHWLSSRGPAADTAADRG